MTGTGWSIEPATPESLADILVIEETCFSTPWTRKMLEAELNGNPFAHFLIARQEGGSGISAGPVVGYLCYWIVFEEVRLMNLAVIESMRNRGIAKSLVATALKTGFVQSAHRAVLEVRASNLAARALYEGFGFRQMAVRPKYYNNPMEDAVLMELDPIVLKSGSGSALSEVKGGDNQSLR